MSLHLREPEVIPLPGYLDQQNPLDGFDWAAIEHELERIQNGLATAASFLVLFTSEQRVDITDEDKELLRTLDSQSHDEASESEALVKYFAGEVDSEGRALSWCLWTDRRAAAEALHGPSHKEAIQLAKAGRFYKQFMVRFYAVSRDPEKGFVFTPMITNHNFETQHKEREYANL